jgi:cytochrome c553
LAIEVGARRARVVGTRARALGLRLAAASILAGVPVVHAADAAAGRAKAESCVVCHGADGIATAPSVPNLAGQPEPYLVDQLRQFRSGRRPSEVMAVIARPLADADIADLAAWFASIRITATTPGPAP